MEQKNALVVFQDKKIRRIWFNDEWWFSVVDIISALTGTERARKYWSDLKVQLKNEGFELSEKIGQLKLMSSDGKYYDTDCVNTKNAFRIIQSIPSPKAEPFKQWLAQIGYDRIQEIENPEARFQTLSGKFSFSQYNKIIRFYRIYPIFHAVRGKLSWKDSKFREVVKHIISQSDKICLILSQVATQLAFEFKIYILKNNKKLSLFYSRVGESHG